MATVYCSSCGAPYSASREKCPNCGNADPEALTNTLAPAADTGDDEEAELARRFGRAKEPTMDRDCPKCAETIKAKAKVCRFCGYDLQKHDDRLVDDEDDDEEDDRPRRGRKKRSKSERLPRRMMSPNTCPCGGYRVPKTPVWAIILCIFFFPLGLLFLLVKETRCQRCGM